MCDEQWNIFLALVECWQLDIDDVKSIIKVCAEPALPHEFLQVPVRSRNYSNVDLLCFRTADRPYLVFLEYAQQFDLQAHRHIADLIEHQRAALGSLEEAFVRTCRTGEGAFFVPEQFRLEQVFGHGRAIDSRERSIVARAGTVNCLGEQFLARAAFTRDENACVGRGDHLRLLQDFLHCSIARNDLRGPVFLDINRARYLERPLDQ